MGPDHCAAMATLGTQQVRHPSWALKAALRFALGHALVLGSVAAGCLLLGLGISEAFEKWAEIFGGVLLMGLAVTALLFPGALQHGHPHFGSHGPDHEHAQIPLAAGALMALSGVRSLLLALPPLMVGGSGFGQAWLYLPGFALGILVGMGLWGVVISATLKTLRARVLLHTQRTVALATGALGAYWIIDRL